MRQKGSATHNKVPQLEGFEQAMLTKHAELREFAVVENVAFPLVECEELGVAIESVGEAGVAKGVVVVSIDLLVGHDVQGVSGLVVMVARASWLKVDEAIGG